MKRVASCLAALAALGSTGVYARPTRIRCTPHHEVIRSGDNAMGLVRHYGIDAAHFSAWMRKASPATHQALRHMHPGDVFDICLIPAGHAGPTLTSLRLVRDEAGRKQADRQAISSGQPSRRLFADVTSGVVATDAPTVAPTPSSAGPSPRIKPLAPGHLLNRELTRLLGHHPVVADLLAYAREHWHLPARLPRDSHCTLAFLPSAAPGSRTQLAYLQLDYRGRRDRVYRYVDSRGHAFMVGAHGKGFRVLDPLLPVSHARISSGWGWRIQPVLGGDEFHQGIDYAAPTGTPVRATVDGVVDISGWHGGYGRMVEIRHSRELSTRYGHLSAFAAHARLGSHVHRGQIIGYVGSSGLSTGPHLYYEVWDHGKRINPLLHRQLMVAARLDPHERQRFVAYVNHIMAAP